MGEVQHALGQPGVGLFTMLIIGAIAGWIGEKVTASDHGMLTNILVGVCGAFVAGKLAEVLDITVLGFWRTLVSASIGAILILWVWRAVRARSV